MAYNWDFGDESFIPATLNQPRVIKSWSRDSEYNVRCVVSDMKGGVVSKSLIVRIGEPNVYRLMGRVLLAGRPLEGVGIEATGPMYKRVQTDTDGAYTLPGLSPGSYTITATKSGYTFVGQFPQPTTVRSNHVTGLDFRAIPLTRPLIEAFSPSSGSVASVVSIFGTNFSLVDRVSINGIASAFSIVNAGELAGTVPEGATSGYISAFSPSGTATGADVFHVIASPPEIIIQPQSVRIYGGSNATFVVKTSGSGPLTWQWRHDAFNIPGATNGRFSILNAQISDGGIYDVVVSNPVGTNRSAPATLTVVPPPTLAEALDGSNLVWSTGGNVPWLAQTNVTHDRMDAAETGGLAYNQASSVRTTVIGPGRAGFWWRISSGIPGVSDNPLTFRVGATAKMAISYERDWSYASSYVPDGEQVLSWTYSVQSPSGIQKQNKAWLDEVTFTHIDGSPPVFTQQPQGQILEVGDTAVLTARASGSEPISYQWRRVGGIIPDATDSTLIISNVGFSDGGLYVVRASNALDAVDSTNVFLEVRQTRPVVTLSSPLGAAVETPDVPLRAQANDPDGSIASLAFFMGTNQIGLSANLPFADIIVSNLPWGAHTFTARATDNSGKIGTSAPVTISVTALILKGSIWKYLDDGTHPSAAWRDVNFDDSAWLSGRAELGYGNCPVTTIGFGPDPENKNIATFFRHQFQFPGGSASNLTLRLKADDGAVVYFNGIEVFRHNMPAGAVDNTTRALSAIENGREKKFVAAGIPPALLVPGTNLLAVEVHQFDAISVDLSFDAALSTDVPWSPPKVRLVQPAYGEELIGSRISLRATAEDFDGHVERVEFFHDGVSIGEDTSPPFSIIWSNVVPGEYAVWAVATDNTGLMGFSDENDETWVRVHESLVPWGADWRYLDNGSDLARGWQSPNFDDSSWAVGAAELGYGNEPSTLIGFGPDPRHKYITTYFRHSFQLSDLDVLSNPVVRLKCDDGAVVYLNGAELFRYNMPEGVITSQTLASSTILDPYQQPCVQRGIARNFFLAGRNTIAVEVHQANTASPDLAFNLALCPSLPPAQPSIWIASPVVDNLQGPIIRLTAEAADADGHIASVQWFARTTVNYSESPELGMKIGEKFTPPFTVLWTNNTACSYRITAVATDNNGQSARIATVVELTSPSRVTSLLRNEPFWKYLDDGADQCARWREPDFDDSSWKVGLRPFGFGDDLSVTFVPRAVTTYFRYHFTTFDDSITNISLLYEPQFGDGAVAYLNGIEIFRTGLPYGELSAQACAGPFSPVWKWTAAALRGGDNVLAVEWHQTCPIPTYSIFRADLLAERSTEPPPLTPCLLIELIDLLFREDGPYVLVSWGDDNFWYLESAADLSGPWTPAADNSSALFLATPRQKFFRLSGSEW